MSCTFKKKTDKYQNKIEYKSYIKLEAANGSCVVENGGDVPG